ncbi:hypothetical protein EUTSA_v10011640mg [Eutrema salsugineum]|uniref:Uncharacterized protein n=1 Tax=Eutrema salsugineum TaxID=72664 RepID=V4JZ49_EUTSA|nr:hypothetical protein EUTSA_v10011640mg [Eutrema salsugineum]
MNTFRLGTLIRRTASQISSNQFLRFSGSFASISKSRFFSNEADGESAVYHHARLFRKPLSIGFTSNLSNSVSLMGFVNRPIRVIDTVEPDRFGVSTLLRVKDPRDQNRSFSIPLSMWDAMARKCIAHLKPNDFIHVSGRLVSFGNENSSLGLKYQVKVTEVNYVMAPPSHVLVSQTPQKPKSETDGIEESKNDEIHLWNAFFANPDEWWDKRRNKKNPKQPDFKHKDTNEAFWLGSDTPVWVTRQLELFDQKRPDVFFANPQEWWDNRRDKLNPRWPDFKHKDTGEALWLHSDTPVWVSRQLELLDQRNANKSCYDQKQTRRGNLADWL